MVIRKSESHVARVLCISSRGSVPMEPFNVLNRIQGFALVGLHPEIKFHVSSQNSIVPMM